MKQDTTFHKFYMEATEMENYIFPKELFAPYHKYPLIQQHPSFFIWETIEDGEKKTVFTPLFQSFTAEENEVLLNSYYGAENIQEEIRKINDGTSRWLEVDYYLAFLTLNIQENAKELHIINSRTGELLEEIQLTVENLNRKLEDFFYSEALPLHFYSVS